MRVHAAILFSVVPALSFAQEAPTLRGFSAEGSAKQRELEAKFDASLNKENLRQWMKRMTLKPHHVGSSYGKDNAEFALALFKSWGYDARIETFDVLLPIPKSRILSLTAPAKYKAKLWEPALKEDK